MCWELIHTMFSFISLFYENFYTWQSYAHSSSPTSKYFLKPFCESALSLLWELWAFSVNLWLMWSVPHLVWATLIPLPGTAFTFLVLFCSLLILQQRISLYWMLKFSIEFLLFLFKKVFYWIVCSIIRLGAFNRSQKIWCLQTFYRGS